MEAMHRAKRQAAGASLAFNILSTLVKAIAAALTGSVGLLSEAIHSFSDVFSSGIALASIGAAAQPPDEEHPFGHGKIESLAGFGESIILFATVAYVVYEAIHRLLEPQTVQSLDLGLAVMGASAAGSLIVGIYVRRVAHSSHSLALQSNSQHLFVDALTSFGVLVGLGIVRLSGWGFADSIVALGLAVWMTLGAWKLSRIAFHDLIDVRLPEEEIGHICEILESTPSLLGYHRLRTRRSGHVRFVDLHVVVPREWSVVEAHDLADELEKRIAQELAPANVVIHVDPFNPAKVESG